MITIDSKTELGSRIAEVMNECGSDKDSAHSYSEGYSYFIDKVLGRTPETFLEIGIANVSPENSSLHGWSKIFPNAMIYGIDIQPEKMIQSSKISTFVVDQSSILDLSNFKKSVPSRFDVILDDGSHIFNHAAVTFTSLFNRLSSNGLYMVEDVGKSNIWGQSVDQWNDLLSQNDMIHYEIIDCKPSKPEDDSVLIGIWRKMENIK